MVLVGAVLYHYWLVWLPEVDMLFYPHLIRTIVNVAALGILHVSIRSCTKLRKSYAGASPLKLFFTSMLLMRQRSCELIIEFLLLSASHVAAWSCLVDAGTDNTETDLWGTASTRES
jgi:hypothetical protein